MSPEPTGWPDGPDAPVLRDDQVHVWRADLALDGAALEALARLLADDERGRAARFRPATARCRFVIARAMLRDVLARYLGEAPAALRFAYGDQGKPALVAPSGAAALRFNLSHSGGLALCAVARGRDVGVDVEQIRDVAVARLAARFYAPAEQAALAALAPAAARTVFFRLWTCKEAYLKATGTGVSRPLAEVAVALAGDEPRLAVTGDAGATSRWTLREIDAGQGYAAALAAEGRGWSVIGWRWRSR